MVVVVVVVSQISAAANPKNCMPFAKNEWHTYMKEKGKILFVCIENSNRSQMAEAFAKILGGKSIDSFSAGSSPSGKINPKAIAAMKELGYNLSTHHSKSLEEIKQFAPFEVVVTMGCGDACPWMPAKKFIDW